jgi:hypothetical protein
MQNDPSKYPDFSSTESGWQWYTGEVFLPHWLESILDLSIPDNQRTSRAIAANFQSCNRIAEVIDRHIAALSPSNLSFDNPLLQSLIEKWERENSGIFGHPLEEAALRAKIDGRAYLRLFFKKSYAGEAALDFLEVHCPPVETVKAYRDGDRFLTGFEYSYIDNNEQYTEKQFLNGSLTVFQTIYKGEIIAEKTFERDLGGGFSIVEINLKPMLTESIKENQNGINFALTLLPTNLARNGWLQKTVLNGQPPGKWDFDDKGREVFTPSKDGLPAGPGITQFIQGLPITDERGVMTGYTVPDMRSEQPISPETFTATVRAFSQLIYEQVDQSYILASDLVLSGVSREQSRRDFADIVNADAVKLGYVYSDLLTVCNYFLGVKQPIKAQLKPRIDRGIEHKKLVLEARSQGLITKRTAIEALGFEIDIDAELAELEKEAQKAAELQKPPETIKPSGGAIKDEKRAD